MRGGKNKQPLGYTIVEVLIVLAVSGVMFILAANFISQREAKTAFSQGSDELTGTVQTTISQVTSGQYSDVNFTCTTIGSGATATISITSGGTGQNGKNPSCVFIGKIIVLPDVDNTHYAIYSLAAGRDGTTV